MGKIAHLLQTTQSLETPLQRRLEQLGKILIIIALLLTADGHSDEEIIQEIQQSWNKRDDRYSVERSLDGSKLVMM